MGEVEAISCMAYSRERSFLVELSSDKSLPYDLEIMEVDTLYDKVFTPQIVVGSWQTASRMPNAVIISRSTAIKIFGQVETAIGKHLTLTETALYFSGQYPEGRRYCVHSASSDGRYSAEQWF